MVVEVDLSDTTINLNNLLPVVRGSGAVVVFNQLKLVRESSSENKVILPILIVTADFLDDQTLEVLINGDTADQTINLRAFRVEVNLALLVEYSFLSIRT